MTIPEKAAQFMEEWKPIDGFDGYFVSNMGNIIGPDGRQKAKALSKQWPYYSVSLYKDGKESRKLIHRLVAQAFIPNEQNLPMVNHKDENKLNNCADNLEWCDARYNNNYGEHLIAARKKVADARRTFVECVTESGIEKYESIRDASRKTGINRNCISRACRGEYSSAGGYMWRYTK